jgi:hypothetical protein
LQINSIPESFFTGVRVTQKRIWNYFHVLNAREISCHSTILSYTCSWEKNLCLLKGCMGFGRQSFNAIHLFSSSFWLGMTPTTRLWWADKKQQRKN